MFRLGTLSILVVAAASSLASPANAQPAYSWTLPKTVMDVTVVYTYAGCTMINGQQQLKIKVAPTIAPRAVADPAAGFRTQATGDLANSAWQDRNITITTFSGSHILNTVSAHPVNQTGTVIGNILGGLGKIVAVALGVPGAGAGAVGPAANPPVETDCPDDKDPGHQVKVDKKKIGDLQRALAADNVTDAQQKQYTAQIQALQTVVVDEQSKMTFTIKATIDPGYTNPDAVEVGSDAPPAQPFPPTPAPGKPELGSVAKNGLIGSLTPTRDQLTGVSWIKDPTDATSIAKLKVNVYMDFAHSVPSKEPKADTYYHPTAVVSHTDAITYRDVAYIPVLIWLGDKDQPGGGSQLLTNIRLPFAQYGEEQVLPLDAGTFKDITWSITFAENGEITSGSMTSKSLLVNATSLFAPAATAANSIATEVRASDARPSPQAVTANEAQLLQSQGDEIYERHRVALCQANPAECPSK